MVRLVRRTASTMGYTQWLLVQQSDGSFKFVSDARYADFHAGRTALQQAKPGEVLTVEVVLHLEDRVPGEVIFVEHRRFPVLENGHRDPASIEWELNLIRETMSAALCESREPATLRWARRQHAAAFRWTPTESESQLIADMVSRRAKQPLLGGRVLHLADAR